MTGNNTKMTTNIVIQGLEKLISEFESSYNCSSAVVVLFGVAKIYELENQQVKVAETLVRIAKILIQDKKFNEASDILKIIVQDLVGVPAFYDIYLEAQYYAILSILADKLDWKTAWDLLDNYPSDLLLGIIIAVKTKDVGLFTETMIAFEENLNNQFDVALFYHIKCSLKEAIVSDNQ